MGGSQSSRSKNRGRGHSFAERRRLELVHENMVKTTQLADDRYARDVEGQRLANLLNRARIAFGAESREYSRLRLMLIEGAPLKDLETHCNELINTKKDCGDDHELYLKKRKEALDKLEDALLKLKRANLKQKNDSLNGKESKKRKTRKKKKKKTKGGKHRHQQHINYTGKEGDYLDDLVLDAKLAFQKTS